METPLHVFAFGAPHSRNSWPNAKTSTSVAGWAVITAGPPGAGKTTTIDQHGAAELGDLSRYRRVDPDSVKDLLLNRAIADGIYEAMLRDHLADGRPLMARELSGLVHEEAVRLAREMRRQCMSRGESLIIEGS